MNDLVEDPAREFGELDDCPNCAAEGLVWGCFEDTCVCVDDGGLGCAPVRCDWCRVAKPRPLPGTAAHSQQARLLRKMIRRVIAAHRKENRERRRSHGR